MNPSHIPSRETEAMNTTYTGRPYDTNDWIAHIDQLRRHGELVVGEWHGYTVAAGDPFGPHRGPLYVLVPWRVNENYIAVAHRDPDEAVALASRLEVEL